MKRLLADVVPLLMVGVIVGACIAIPLFMAAMAVALPVWWFFL